jgi:hypothetical protein
VLSLVAIIAVVGSSTVGSISTAIVVARFEIAVVAILSILAWLTSLLLAFCLLGLCFA